MAKKAAVPRKKVQTERVPVLLEVVYTFSQLFIVIVGVLVASVSILSGNDLWMTVLQTGITVLALGLLIWLTNWLLSEGLLESTLAKMKEEAEQEAAERKAAMEEAYEGDSESLNQPETV